MATYYANSETGDDSNAGTVAGAPLQTLAAVLAKQSSGKHVAHLVGDFTAESEDIGTAYWVLVGEESATTTLTVTTAMFSAAENYQTFKHLTISGDTAGYLNANNSAFVDCEFGAVRPFGSYYVISTAVNCKFTGSGSLNNVYGSFMHCELYGSVSTGNANDAFFTNCLFTGNGATSVSCSQRAVFTNCTFYNQAFVQASSSDFGYYTNCVFHGGDVDRGATQPRGQYNYLYSCVLLENCAGWNGTAYFTQGHNDYTDLAADPYPNAGSGDFTPSAEVQALTDARGRYPGCQLTPVVSSGGGGDTVTAALHPLALTGRR